MRVGTLTRYFHTDRPFLLKAQKRVLRGLGAMAMTCPWGSGRGGADESCFAADVGKYICGYEFTAATSGQDLHG